jgi:hypothetical protein
MTEVNTTLPSQPVHWALRPRESSDRSSQPHSAPTGSIAQQSENFQRFFRAVRSPTHVRVTAGGRIVPNTRTTAPPAFNWNSENNRFETNKPPSEVDSTSQQQLTWLHNEPLPLGFPPILPSSFMSPPGSFHPQASLATMASPQFNSFGGHDHLSAGQNQIGKAFSEHSPNAEPNASLPQQVKVSHPAQFDNTKPFVYNGQLVFPVPPPSNPQALSMTILGNPNFVPQATTGLFAPPSPFPLPIANMPNPLMFPGQPHPMAISTPSSEQIPGRVPFTQPLMPMPSLSELTRAQIQTLRTHISFIDSQVSNHQFDPNFIQSQRAMVLAQIKSMESMLEAQLAAENSVKAVAQREINSSTSRRLATSQDKSKFPADTRRQDSASHVSQISLRAPSESGLEHSQAHKDIGQQKDLASQRAPFTRSNSMSRSKLSAAAAMAPPFQPRTQYNAVTTSQMEQSMAILGPSSSSPVEEIASETQAQIESRLLSKASTNWGQITDNTTVAVAAPPSLPKAQSMIESSTQAQSQARSMPRSSTFHGQADLVAPPHHFSNISSHAVPYLVGVLPQGLSTIEANPTDLVYPRPLTEEERRARHLYWGKAPASAQKGLPKFDGKDFYPPSPTKQNARLVTYSTPPGPASCHNPHTSALPDFGKLFTEPGAPGYKTPSPMRTSSSHPNLVSLPIQNAMPSDRSSMQESSNLALWPTQYTRQEEQVRRPITPQERTKITDGDDFSNLFLERGVPGYQSPVQERPFSSHVQSDPINQRLEGPVTPKKADDDEHFGDGGGNDVCSVDSWGASRDSTKWKSAIRIVPAASVYDGQGVTEEDCSDSSSVEINLTSQKNGALPKASMEYSWQERVANFSK